MKNITPDLIARFSEDNITLIPEFSDNNDVEFPCVTYFEQDNSDERIGDTLGYSSIRYLIQVWDKDYKELINTAVVVDSIMKELNFQRISCNEQKNGSLYRKILSYQKLIKEIY